MKSKIEKSIRNYVNKVWKDNDDNLGFRIGDNNKIEEIGRLEFTKKELLKYSTLLIDHLNSQDQEGENNTKLVTPPSAYDQAEKEGFDMKNKVKSELIPQDTPEEWEELETAINIFKNRIKEVDEIGFKVNGQRFVIKRDPSKLKDNK